MQKVYIYLENGIFLEANSFGADTTAVGKLVYNNSTFGQQEIITDPSNNGIELIWKVQKLMQKV